MIIIYRTLTLFDLVNVSLHLKFYVAITINVQARCHTTEWMSAQWMCDSVGYHTVDIVWDMGIPTASWDMDIGTASVIVSLE